MRALWIGSAVLWMLLQAGAAPADPTAGGFIRLRHFDVPEARQAVAVDADHFYAVANRRPGKYPKRGAQRPLRIWEGGASILHLNSGRVVHGILYCAHSNYPATPMTRSIEMFDTESLEHIGDSFGIGEGSATWVDRAHGRWWVHFAHYAGRGGEPDKDVAWSSLAVFDDSWRRVGGYVLPAEVAAALAVAETAAALGDATACCI